MGLSNAVAGSTHKGLHASSSYTASSGLPRVCFKVHPNPNPVSISRHRVLCPGSPNKFTFPFLLLGGHPGINRFVAAGYAIRLLAALDRDSPFHSAILEHVSDPWLELMPQ